MFGMSKRWFDYKGEESWIEKIEKKTIKKIIRIRKERRTRRKTKSTDKERETKMDSSSNHDHKCNHGNGIVTEAEVLSTITEEIQYKH